MKTKCILALGLTVAIGCAVLSLLAVNREAALQAASRAAAIKRAELNRAGDQAFRLATPVAAPTVLEQWSPERTTASSDQTQPERSVKPDGQTSVKTQAVAGTASDLRSPRLDDPKVKEQLGRLALSFVGVDADAEEIWLWAINDPSLSASARQNLIEDLNEDGLSDPHNPAVDDLPLIESRIALIEEVAPDALDEVNAAGFQEAYKDLVNMWLRLIQQ